MSRCHSNQYAVFFTEGFGTLTGNDEVCDVPVAFQEYLETIEESHKNDHGETKVRGVWLERCDVGEFLSVDALFLASVVESEVRAAMCKGLGNLRLLLDRHSTYMKIEVQVRSPVIDDKFANHWKTLAELSETFTGERTPSALLQQETRSDVL